MLSPLFASFVGCLTGFQLSVTLHRETSHLFCSAKYVTSFCMKCNTGLKWVKIMLRVCVKNNLTY